MKFQFRGELTDKKKIVDIIELDGEYAICDGDIKRIPLTKFNTIFVDSKTFIKQFCPTNKKKKINQE